MLFCLATVLSCSFNSNKKLANNEFQEVSIRLRSDYVLLIEDFISKNDVPKDWIIVFQVRNNRTFFITSTGDWCFQKHISIHSVRLIKNHFVVFDLQNPIFETNNFNYDSECNTVYDGNFWIVEQSDSGFKIYEVY